MKGVFLMNTEKNKEKWIEKVHENLVLRGRSENTYRNYRCALLKFLNYFDDKTNIKSLKEKNIIDFLNEEYIKPNKCKDTYNLAVCSIRLFYLICFNISLNRLLIPTCKLSKKLPTILIKKDFFNIFNHEKSLKHRCWLLLGFCSGLRVSEVANLKVEDIFSTEHKIKVENGKGNKERYTLLPDVTIKFLRLYCKERNIRSGYLFPGTNNNEVMNTTTIINYFSMIKKTYNLNKNISFHSLRHAFATYYLLNGGSLLTLQSMLGHKSLNTTIIYIHLALNFNNLEGVKYV